MLMTREMDYALRILRALYRGGQMSAATVARKEHMPKAVTLKILKQLHTAGFLDSRRGSNGGYLLQESCGQLYLGDVFCALGEPLCINRCQQPEYQCENASESGCSICQELNRIQELLDKELYRTPLSEVFKEDP